MGRVLYRCALAVCVIVFVIAGAMVVDYYLSAYKSAGDFDELARFVGASSDKKRVGDHGAISNGSTGEVALGTEGRNSAYEQNPSHDRTTVANENHPSGNRALPTSANTPSVEGQTEISGMADDDVQPASSKTDQIPQKQTEVLADPRILALRALAERNTDMVGWVQIDGTPIDYPVMQSKDDAEYYLYRDFERQQSDYGTPFIGSFCDVDKPSDNILIYGHHMRNGSMFAGLMNYEDREFFERHQIIRFDTLNELGNYQIIAVFKSQIHPKDSKAFEYHMFTDAAYPDIFDEYVANVKRLSLYDTEHTAAYGDKLITLSTCEYTRENGRMVVVARRIAQ